MGAYLLKYRFSILCVILFVLMVFQAINGQWGGDFWEHAGSSCELATHPFSPKHPLLLLDAPHSFLFSLCPGDCSHLSDHRTGLAFEL